MNLETYLHLRRAIVRAGYASEIDWSENLLPVADAHAFWGEYAWVVLNSGMKNQIARVIWDKVRPAVESGGSAGSVFGHKGKSAAIDFVWRHRERLFAEYVASSYKVDFLRELPWIGGITCWHLAKNYGHDCAKPDRHLVRIAGSIEAVLPMCEDLAKATGDRIATVDLVIWRAANLGLA